ncbi:MAG: protein O-mannosyl-transferase family [Chthoniobacterales bacterium]
MRNDKNIAQKHSNRFLRGTSVTPSDSDARPRGPGTAPCFACAGLVFVVALTLYVFTLAPTVTFVDSGELIVVAHSLGVAHPPGFPLWVMLAHLASLLPFGNVAWRLNLSSAVFAATAAALLSLVIIEVLSSRSFGRQKRNRRSRKAVAQSPTATKAGELFAPALTGGLLLAFSRTLWSYATVTEVYTLNTLLILAIFYLALRWRRQLLSPIAPELRKSSSSSPAHLRIYSAAVIFGLALGVHHVTVALTLPAIALLVYRTQGLAFFKSRHLLVAGACSLTALVLVYSYLPLAAARMPVINWGNPRNFGAIWAHITGRQYQSMFAFSPESIAQQFVDFGRLALREFGWPWVPVWPAFALAGFIFLFRGDRTLFWFLVLVVGFNLAFGLIYDIAEDKDAYYLPAFLCLVFAGGAGLRWLMLVGWWRSRTYIIGATGLLLLLVPLRASWPFNNRSHYYLADDYVENIFRSIEPNGLLLTLDWQVASPMLYARQIAGNRPDITVVDIQLCRRAWYFDYLKRSYPDFVNRSQPQTDAFTEEVQQWEVNPSAYGNDTSNSLRIALKFQAMLRSFVTNQEKLAPVYLTRDFLIAERGDKEFTTWVAANYDLVPEGLVFKVLPRTGTFHKLDEVRWKLRGLVDGTLKFESDDVVRTKVLPAYTIMLVNRGRYLALFGQYQQAIDAFAQALSLDPNMGVAQEGMKDSILKLNQQR